MRKIKSPLDGFLSPFGRVSAGLRAITGIGAANWNGYSPNASGVTWYANPGAGAATWTGFAPTLKQALLTGVGSATWTGFAPAIAGLGPDYSVAGFNPDLVADFSGSLNSDTPYYRQGGSVASFPDFLTHARAGNATMVDSSGNLVWAPHNLALNSAAPATQSITVVSGADYTVEITGSGSVALTGAGTGTVTAGSPVEITASTTTLTLTVTGTPSTMWCYRSDLGGMALNPDTGTSYVPTTTSAVYLPRRNHHRWNGSAWVNKGLLLESEARTNLVTQSGDLSAGAWTPTGASVSTNQSDDLDQLTATGSTGCYVFASVGTPSVASHTLSAVVEAGTNSVFWLYFLSIASSGAAYFDVSDETTQAVAGSSQTPSNLNIEEIASGRYRISATWVGAGVSANVGVGVSNSKGSIAQTSGRTGVVGRLQFELGSTPSSDIPTSGSTATRAAETLTIAGADMPASTSNMSLHMEGEITYADNGAESDYTFWRWYNGASDYLLVDLDTDSTDTGEINAVQADTVGGTGTVTSDSLSPGINVAFNFATRHTSSEINLAVAGTAVTADTTPTALHDASGDTFQLGYDYMGTIALFRAWDDDLGDIGIASASL